MLLSCFSSSPVPRAFLCEESEHFQLKVKCKAQDAFARLRWESGPVNVSRQNLATHVLHLPLRKSLQVKD